MLFANLRYVTTVSRLSALLVSHHTFPRFLLCAPQDDYPPLPEGISEALRDFLLQCFKKEPLLRKSAQELLKHPWLKNPRNHLEKVRPHT